MMETFCCGPSVANADVSGAECVDEGSKLPGAERAVPSSSLMSSSSMQSSRRVCVESASVLPMPAGLGRVIWACPDLVEGSSCVKQTLEGHTQKSQHTLCDHRKRAPIFHDQRVLTRT